MGNATEQGCFLIFGWNESVTHKNRIYISYYSTNKNCQAGDIDLAEFGHAKDDKSKPIINYSVGYDRTNRIPQWYEAYPGSVVVQKKSSLSWKARMWVTMRSKILNES